MVGGGRGRDEEAVVAVSQGRSALAGVGGLAPGDEKKREQRKTNDWQQCRRPDEKTNSTGAMGRKRLRVQLSRAGC